MDHVLGLLLEKEQFNIARKYAELVNSTKSQISIKEVGIFVLHFISLFMFIWVAHKPPRASKRLIWPARSSPPPLFTMLIVSLKKFTMLSLKEVLRLSIVNKGGGEGCVILSLTFHLLN